MAVKGILYKRRHIIIALLIFAASVFIVTAHVHAAMWINYGDTYLLMDEYGTPLTGWQAVDGSWYFTDEYGLMQTGWIYSDGSWYYLNSDGSMTTGWINLDNDWYFFDSKGHMTTGWNQIYGNWYFFDAAGALKTGWLYSGGYWYYFDEDGKMLTGWQSVDGEWYYFQPYYGYMAKDCWVLDDYGAACYLNAEGVWETGHLTWIGDSISTWDNGRNAIYSMFYDPDIDSQASRRIYEDLEGNPSGLTVARRLASEGRIQDYVVFQMGTNTDDSYPNISTNAKINELISIVGSDKKIVLVTVYDTNDWCTNWYYGTINNEIRTIAANNPNIVVADWAAYCNPDTDLVDWAHPTAAGGYKYMSLIRNVMVNSFGP